MAAGRQEEFSWTQTKGDAAWTPKADDEESLFELSPDLAVGRNLSGVVAGMVATSMPGWVTSEDPNGNQAENGEQQQVHAPDESPPRPCRLHESVFQHIPMTPKEKVDARMGPPARPRAEPPHVPTISKARAASAGAARPPSTPLTPSAFAD